MCLIAVLLTHKVTQTFHYFTQTMKTILFVSFFHLIYQLWCLEFFFCFISFHYFFCFIFFYCRLQGNESKELLRFEQYWELMAEIAKKGIELKYFDTYITLYTIKPLHFTSRVAMNVHFLTVLCGCRWLSPLLCFALALSHFAFGFRLHPVHFSPSQLGLSSSTTIKQVYNKLFKINHSVRRSMSTMSNVAECALVACRVMAGGGGGSIHCSSLARLKHKWQSTAYAVLLTRDLIRLFSLAFVT